MFCFICHQKLSKRIHQRDAKSLEMENFVSRGENRQTKIAFWYCVECDHFSQALKESNVVGNYFDRYQAVAHPQTIESTCAAKTYQEIIENFAIPFESLLDIGPGDGSLLLALYKSNNKLKLSGIGPEKRPSDLPAVIDWYNEDLSLSLSLPKSKKFHLIFFGTSLEHIENPEETLKKARLCQNGGDKLMVIFHDPYAWPQKILGKYSPVWSEQHLNVFSQRSLEKMMTKCSYHLQENISVQNKYPLSYLIRLLPWKITRLFSRFVEKSFLDLIIPINLGNRAMLFYAKDANE